MYSFTAKRFAEALDKYQETTSRLGSRDAVRRVEDQDFNERNQQFDSVITGSFEQV